MWLCVVPLSKTATLGPIGQKLCCFSELFVHLDIRTSRICFEELLLVEINQRGCLYLPLVPMRKSAYAETREGLVWTRAFVGTHLVYAVPTPKLAF